LNPCGGAEHVALATIEALIEMENIDEVKLTTARIPVISKLKNVFGADRIDSIFNHVKIDPLDNLLAGRVQNETDEKDHDTITINTHGDMLPYYLPSFSTSNAITYCHYPLAIDLARQHDPNYIKWLTDLGLVNGTNDENGGISDDNTSFWQALQDSYLLMLKHSIIITNSIFSKEAITRVLNTTRSTVDRASKPLIIPPPVNVEEFSKVALYSKEREDLIVVISRFHPAKKLENTIELARMLQKQKIGKGMIMVGGLMSEDCNYYHHIAQMIKSCDLDNYLRLEVNISSDVLKSILRQGKVYYHPMPEEPFGISIVEAMSAGLVPIVPEIGGQTDFVPRKYRYSSLAEAAMKISVALIASQEERSTLSQNVASFSKANYISRIQKVVMSLLQGPKMMLDAKEASTPSTSPLPSLLQPKFPLQKFFDMKNKK